MSVPLWIAAQPLFHRADEADGGTAFQSQNEADTPHSQVAASYRSLRSLPRSDTAAEAGITKHDPRDRHNQFGQRPGAR